MKFRTTHFRHCFLLHELDESKTKIRTAAQLALRRWRLISKFNKQYDKTGNKSSEVVIFF